MSYLVRRITLKRAYNRQDGLQQLCRLESTFGSLSPSGNVAVLENMHSGGSETRGLNLLSVGNLFGESQNANVVVHRFRVEILVEAERINRRAMARSVDQT